MKIVDLARAVSPESALEEIGMRPGEKLHEEMISSDDSRRTIILKDRFVVTPVVAEWGYKPPLGEAMAEGSAYKSDTNEQWMSESDIKKFIGWASFSAVFLQSSSWMTISVFIKFNKCFTIFMNKF